jgi:hypothetical protein
MEKCGDPTYKNTISGGANIGERTSNDIIAGSGEGESYTLLHCKGTVYPRSSLNFSIGFLAAKAALHRYPPFLSTK